MQFYGGVNFFTSDRLFIVVVVLGSDSIPESVLPPAESVFHATVSVLGRAQSLLGDVGINGEKTD